MKKTSNKIAALVLSAAMCVTLLAGCGKTTTASDSTPASTSKASVSASVEEKQPEVKGYSEAPMLADQVAAGTLPKVEDRVPNADNVFVETKDANGDPIAIGTYGGKITMTGVSGWGLSRPINESIIRFNCDGTWYPNVMKSIEHNADSTVWTFHLREGMKWSDGDDFNADDITFWYYMCHRNNFDGKKNGWKCLLDQKVDDVQTYPELAKVDDYTVTWTFTQPKYEADFILDGDFKWCWAPSHYLKDLIPNYEGYEYVENPYWPNPGERNEEAVLAAAKTLGIEGSSTKDVGKVATYNWWNCSGLPTLCAFTLPANSSIKDPLCVAVRNPYYWKVDAEGKQLPYLDELNFYTCEDEQRLLLFRDGTLDIIDIGVGDIASTLSDMGGAASLKTFASVDWGDTQITFNYTIADENYAKLFANPDFRQAMSICVDRTKVSELLSEGFLEPGQCAPGVGNFGYDPEWTSKWTEYDVAKAKKLLEGCGLVMGSDGFYTFADGTPLRIDFYTYDNPESDTNNFAVLAQYFKAAGINCAQKNMELSAYDQAIDNNDWCACIGPHTSIGGLGLNDRPAPFVPIAQAAEWYGEYGTYYGTGGAQGVKPEGDMAKLVELYEQWKATDGDAAREAIALQIYEIHKNNLWTIAYMKNGNGYVLANSKIQNYADTLVYADKYQNANIVHYATLFIAE
ncbi:MAG: hypothetical protein K6E32_04935 [Lachnospiraceae bacterium]|nr:hypothetical protein [Lachnospiraceae bacterium]